MSRLSLEPTARGAQLFALQIMFTAIAPLVAGVELVTELLSVAVLLMALDKLATAIRWTYAAGKFTGRLWFLYGLPLFLLIADGISAICSRIDWAEIATETRQILVTLTVSAITIATIIRDWHLDWIGTIDWSVPTPPAPPAIDPLFDIAISLEQLTCKQIRTQFGLKQQTRKSKLIAIAIAG